MDSYPTTKARLERQITNHKQLQVNMEAANKNEPGSYPAHELTNNANRIAQLERNLQRFTDLRN